jgi:3-dehydroquinate synthase
MKLNLGHTIGHGVEACSRFQLSHGKSVAIGMAIVARAAAKMGMCTDECSEKIQNLLKDFGLPVDTSYGAEELFACALSDKKRSGSSVRLIIPREIGRCDIVPTPVSELTSLIEAGL